MDVKVNDAEWKGLGKDEQGRIESIVGGFFKGARIIPDPAAPQSARLAAPAATGDPICEAACTIAETAAIAACASLGPIAGPICVAAAKVAGDACRNAC